MNRAVWVVDDNAAVAESVVALLASERIPAIAMSRGREVLERLESGESPALLVMDVNMPNNGHTLLQEIQNVPQWTFPVIVLSGYEDQVGKGVAARAMKSLPKTVEPLELIRWVRRAVGTAP